MVPTIIVTGASRGLGEALSQSAANLGANVVLNSRSILDLDRLVREIEDNGGKAVAVQGDVSLVQDCQRIVEKTVESYGRIDALVNNAATVEPIALIASTDPAEWERSWAVNVFGPMVLTQAALPYLRESNGRVINISSGAAERAIAGAAGYCVTKGALKCPKTFTGVLSVTTRMENCYRPMCPVEPLRFWPCTHPMIGLASSFPGTKIGFRN
jgi:NAD(P)-dependent dehydrogenase (short-subunit alcohol dehydrogenase family)